MYQLLFHPKFKKQLKKLHPRDQKHFLKTLPKLQKNPRSPALDVKKLVGTRSSYRLRLADFRVIFSLSGQTIYFWEIAYRASVY